MVGTGLGNDVALGRGRQPGRRPRRIMRGRRRRGSVGCDGAEVGRNVGIGVGTSVGGCVGAEVGTKDGIGVGTRDGWCVGAGVSTLVGWGDGAFGWVGVRRRW